MRKIIATIITSVLLAGLFTWGKYQLYEWRMPHANYGIRAIASQPQIGTLFVGSSMFRKGIFAPDFGSDAWLLAYNGNQPAYEYLQLTELCRQDAHIRRLVVDMYPYSMIPPASLSDLRMLHDGDMSFSYSIYKLNKDVQSGPQALWKMLGQANNEMVLTWSIAYPMLNSRYLQGANPSEVPGADKEWLDTFEAPEMQVTQNQLHPDQTQGLADIIALCQREGIELLFLETPKYQRVYEDGIFRTIMQQYTDFLIRRHQHMILCDNTRQMLQMPADSTGLITTYSFDSADPTLFSDRIHLSSAGRRALSDKVKTILRSTPTPNTTINDEQETE